MRENKHQPYELAQMQSMSLEAKIKATKQRIRGWYDHWDGNVYVSISGGKDSQVLADIVRKMYHDVPLVFINTGLEHNSVRRKGLEMADRELRPTMDFVSVITKYGYPVISKEVSDCVEGARRYLETNGKKGSLDRLNKLRGERRKKNGELSIYNYKKNEILLEAPFRISPYCCVCSKKEPAKRYEKETGNKPFIGTMANESRLRRDKWIEKGCNAFEDDRPISRPLSFWTDQDILHYIKKYNIDIAETYGKVVVVDDDFEMWKELGVQISLYDILGDYEGATLATTDAKRTGCVFCMFGISHDLDRFLRLKKSEPKKYDFVMRGGKFDDKGLWIPDDGLGYRFVIDWLNDNLNLGIKY